MRSYDGQTLQEAEKEIIHKAFEANNGNIRATAKDIGISRANLYRKLKEYDLYPRKPKQKTYGTVLRAAIGERNK